MKIFNINIINIKYKDLFNEIIKFKKQLIVFTPNPEILLKTKTDNEFKSMIEKADYLTADWIGLYIGFQINDNKYWKIINTMLLPIYFIKLFFSRGKLYEKYWERICWSDLTKDLINHLNKTWEKFTIIDLHNPSDLKKVKSQEKFPSLIKSKFENLNFDYFIYDESKKESIIDNIKNSDSKIVFSTLWMKKQEKSVIEIMEKCWNIKLWLWIWSSFDYFTWFQKRAPSIWRKLWLEWLYRLITWPKKIDRLKRLYNAIFVFIYEIIKDKQ